MDVEPVFPAIQAHSELVNPRRNKHGMMYLGSIDPMTAAMWSKECGAGIGTKEFAAYAKKKIMTGGFTRFKADRSKRLY